MSVAKSKQRRSIESLEARLLMSGVEWEPRYDTDQGEWVRSPSLTASLVNGNLKLEGTDRPDVVTIRHREGDGKEEGGARAFHVPGVFLEQGVDYLEIWHDDQIPGHQRWRGWIKNRDVKDFVFLGNAGNDYFQYVETTLDGLPIPQDARRPERRIFAFGGDHDDELYGYMANDILFGDGGIDKLFGGLGCDLLYGGEGNDILRGDARTRSTPSHDPKVDADYLIGGQGADELYGEQGSDVLVGGEFFNYKLPVKDSLVDLPLPQDRVWGVNDLVHDKLYGGQDEADWFFIEFRDEAKDYQGPPPALPPSPFVDGDHLIGAGDHLYPPSHLDWLLNLEKALQLPRPLNTSRLPDLRQAVQRDFPQINPQNFEVLRGYDFLYQCTGASLGWYSGVSPGDDKTLWTPEYFHRVYRSHGFLEQTDGRFPADPSKVEVVVLYRVVNLAVPGGWQITHAARQLADGTWLSKINQGSLIRHKELNDIASNIFGSGALDYGEPYYVYWRERKSVLTECGCASPGAAKKAWHNASNPADVDQSGQANLSDLLMMVTWLRHNPAGPLPDSPADAPPGMLDVNDDGLATLGDLLGIVAALRAGHSNSLTAEGESFATPPNTLLALFPGISNETEDDDPRRIVH
jgi:hypothetical protein